MGVPPAGSGPARPVTLNLIQGRAHRAATRLAAIMTARLKFVLVSTVSPRFRQHDLLGQVVLGSPRDGP